MHLCGCEHVGGYLEDLLPPTISRPNPDQFLCVPQGVRRVAGGRAGGGTILMSSSWMSEYNLDNVRARAHTHTRTRMRPHARAPTRARASSNADQITCPRLLPRAAPRAEPRHHCYHDDHGRSSHRARALASCGQSMGGAGGSRSYGCGGGGGGRGTLGALSVLLAVAMLSGGLTC
jgi:hypothetical protein